MNWYFKIILAQVATQPAGLAGYLERIGATPDIISFITSQNKQYSQFLANEFRKNPSLNIQQLQSFQTPQKQDPYLYLERHSANQYGGMEKWILINFRKLRKGKIPIDGRLESLVEKNLLTDDEYQLIMNFDRDLPQIRDWWMATNPDLASYSAEQAMQASDEWHRTMAGKGEGKIYEPINKKLIMYGPHWKNKKWENWEGWTIQKVVSENDLLAEGNKMSNCVGSYCDKVEREYSIIYSLRDPKNNPHVTMETDKNNNIVQIKGNSNEEPDNMYKAMIKEWILSNKNPGIYQFDDQDEHFDISTTNSTNDELLGLIEEFKNEGDYGIKPWTSYSAAEIAKDALEIEKQDSWMRRGNPEYRGDLSQIPDALFDMIFTVYKKDPKKIIKEIKELEDFAQKQEEEINDLAMEWDLGYGEYPQEEDYKTYEEFEKAEEEYRDAEADYRDEEIRKTPQGGMAGEIFEIINKLREEGKIPAYEERKKLQPKASANWYRKI